MRLINVQPAPSHASNQNTSANSTNSGNKEKNEQGDAGARLLNAAKRDLKTPEIKENKGNPAVNNNKEWQTRMTSASQKKPSGMTPIEI